MRSNATNSDNLNRDGIYMLRATAIVWGCYTALDWASGITHWPAVPIISGGLAAAAIMLSFNALGRQRVTERTRAAVRDVLLAILAPMLIILGALYGHSGAFQWSTSGTGLLSALAVQLAPPVAAALRIVFARSE